MVYSADIFMAVLSALAILMYNFINILQSGTAWGVEHINMHRKNLMNSDNINAIKTADTNFQAY